MAGPTIIGLNDAKAIKRYSAFLAVDTAKTGYFNRKFMGNGPDSGMPIQMLTDLENDAGEQITYDLSMQLRQTPVEGDDVQSGTEEDLKFYTDNLYIDQMRGGVNTGGRMTRKRTLHDLRKVAKKRQAEWWARVFDELMFMYLSGGQGANSGFVFPSSYAGFANNSFSAPDAAHIVYAGDAVSKATIEVADIMDLTTIDRVKTAATMMGGGSEGIPQIQPIMIDGEEHFTLLMNPWQEFDVRTNASTGQWLDIQKAAAAAEGRKNQIFKGALGMYNGIVLHSHRNVIHHADYGAGANLSAARALFMGSQAAVVAFGSPGTGLRFSWFEESRDNGNQIVISTSSIFGIKKCAFNIDGTVRDFGLIVVDTAAADPV